MTDDARPSEDRLREALAVELNRRVKSYRSFDDSFGVVRDRDRQEADDIIRTLALAASRPAPDTIGVCARCAHDLAEHPAGPCRSYNAPMNCHCPMYLRSQDVDSLAASRPAPDTRTEALREPCRYGDPHAMGCATHRLDGVMVGELSYEDGRCTRWVALAEAALAASRPAPSDPA